MNYFMILSASNTNIVKVDTYNSMADYLRSSDTLMEQLLFTTPEEELKASWDYSNHHSSTIIHHSDHFFLYLQVRGLISSSHSIKVDQYTVIAPTLPFPLNIV